MVNKTYFKKIAVVFVLAVLVLPYFFGVFPHTAHADALPVPTSAQWIDRTYIKAGDKYYRPVATFGDWGGGRYMLEDTWHAVSNASGNDYDCVAQITVDDFDHGGDDPQHISAAHFHNNYKAADGTCNHDNAGTPISITNADRRFVTAYKLSDTTPGCTKVDCLGTIFLPIYKRMTDGPFVGNEYTATNGFFKNRPTDSSSYKPNDFPFFTNGVWDNIHDKGAEVHFSQNELMTQFCGNINCADSKYGITFANAASVTDPSKIDTAKYGNVLAGAANGTIGGNGGAPGGLDTKLDCEANILGSGLGIGSLVDSALSWIICPLIDGAVGIINSVGNAVIDQLIINPAVLEGTQTATAIRSAWNDFRIISLSLLILVAMVGIAAGSFIDAYTIKKVLPRMLIAIIAITLSWDLMKLALDVTNAVGIGIRALIEAPFRGLPSASIDPVGVLAGIGITGGVFGLLGTFTFVGTAALAVIVAFIVVAIRYVAIIAFIIIAPLAIMSSILPGTQKLWKLWHEGLSGALLMLPIVTGMLAIGASLGKAVAQLQGGAFGQMMALIVTFGPYFVIPKAFSMAGGLIGTLSGMANDRGRGAFDRLKKFRQNEAHKAWERKKTGNWFRGGNDEKSIRGRLNKRMMQATMLNEAGFNPKRWKENMSHAVGEREAVESEEIMKSPIGRMLQDDDISSALVDANGDEAAFRRILQERAYKRFGGDENRGALDAAVAGAMRLNRKYGAGGVRLAALRSKFNSSTGWNNEWEYETKEDGSFKLDEKGDKIIAKDEAGNNKIWKYSASGEMLNDINKVAGANRVLSTQLLAEARAGQSRAGREDTGGGGFSDTAVEMDKLWRGDAVTYTDDSGAQHTRRYNVEDATEKVTESLINGKSIHEIFRSGKPAVARAVAPVMKKKTEASLKESQERADGQVQQIEVQAQQAINDIQANTAIDRQQKLVRIQQVGEEHANRIAAIRQRQEQEAIRTIAQEQIFHAVGTSSSADVAKELGDSVGNQPFPLEQLPAAVREKVIKGAGTNTPTRSQAYDALRADPTWGAYVKEYGRLPGGGMDIESRVAAIQAQGVSEAEARAQAAREAAEAAEAAQASQGP